MLVGCSNGGNDESSHKDDSSKTEQRINHHLNMTQKDSKRNDTNNKQDNQENNNNKERTSNQNPNVGEQRTSERPTTNSNGNSSDNQNKQQQSVQDNQNKYVAPYQSENATRVARYLSPFEETAVKLYSNYQILKLHFPLPKMKLICMEAKINHIMIIQ